jgi:hypothetical protein
MVSSHDLTMGLFSAACQCCAIIIPWYKQKNMPRPLRLEYPGGFYDVTPPGDYREAIFEGTRIAEL